MGGVDIPGVGASNGAADEPITLGTLYDYMIGMNERVVRLETTVGEIQAGTAVMGGSLERIERKLGTQP